MAMLHSEISYPEGESLCSHKLIYGYLDKIEPYFISKAPLHMKSYSPFVDV